MKEVEVNPELLGGAAVFRGTRVPVKALFESLIAGDTTEQFLRDFPTVSPEQVKKVLYAAEQTFEEHRV